MNDVLVGILIALIVTVGIFAILPWIFPYLEPIIDKWGEYIDWVEEKMKR